MSHIMEEVLVKLSVPLSDEGIQLSTLDQQAQRNYGKLLLLFELKHTNRVSDIVDHLKQGLGAALSEISDFASTVMPRPRYKRKELELRIGPESGVPVRVVNHNISTAALQKGRNEWTYGSYAELAAGNFPLSDIPYEILFAPHSTPENMDEKGIPALLVQINLIDGGIIMGVCWHHTVGDGRSINILMNSWARHTKMFITQGTIGTPATPPEQIKERWRLNYGSRDASIDQLADYVIDHAARSPHFSHSAHLLDRQNAVAVPFTISTWYFSAAALQTLRSTLAQSGLEDAPQFTHSEAVSALMWKHLSLARQLNHAVSGSTSLFSARLDFRARMKPPLHQGFIGNINEPNARVRIPLEEVCAPSTPKSLATLARAIRAAMVSLDEKAVRTFIGLVNSLPAVTDLTWNYDGFPGPDLGVTDLSGLDILQQSWGEFLGSPTCVRSHSRETGLVYFLPLDQEGGWEVQVQSEREAVERLKRDDGFMRYAVFRC